MVPANILVVEDEGLVAVDICRQLAAFGYDRVSTARSAEKALAISEDINFDLALLDIHIHGKMDGVELAHELNQRTGTPVVYLTAFADPATINRAVRTMPYGYLLKPINERELQSTVEMALYRRKVEYERAEAENRAREFERQLLQSQKMDAIGKLSAGLAHELNNTLLTIMGNISLASTDENLSKSMQRRLTHAMEGCERSAKLVQQLLAFARKGMFQPERQDLHRLVEETLDFLRQMLDRKVKVLLVNQTKSLWAEVDRTQFQQVVTNLVLNSQDFMPHGGRIIIELGRASVKSPPVENPGAVPGEYVTVRVIDEGEGIEQESLNRVFEPFYTTKPVGKGTGLGLSVVYGIMQRHHGWVTIDSQKGQGTTCTLYFPESGPVGEELDEDETPMH